MENTGRSEGTIFVQAKNTGIQATRLQTHLSPRSCTDANKAIGKTIRCGLKEVGNYDNPCRTLNVSMIRLINIYKIKVG